MLIPLPILELDLPFWMFGGRSSIWSSCACAGLAQEVLLGVHQVLGAHCSGDGLIAILEGHDALEKHLSPFRIVEALDGAFRPGHDVLPVLWVCLGGDLPCHLLGHCGLAPSLEFVLEGGRMGHRWSTF